MKLWDEIQNRLQVVKVGLKGKHMKVPYGYKVVTSGVCEDGDMFANINTYRWESVEFEDIDLPFDTFDCLIRKMTLREKLFDLRKLIYQK